MVTGVVGHRVEQREQQGDRDGRVEEFGQAPEVELHHGDPAELGPLETRHFPEEVERDPEQGESAQADAQRQQEFAEQVAVEEAHRTGQSVGLRPWNSPADFSHAGGRVARVRAMRRRRQPAAR
ncbi:MAG: hypothetical protein LW626_10980 [Verrucomicrobium sp.]|nr:hypothetical protein [Verrucomicrobium sp.]